jgi:hypothetical protein
MDADRVLLHTDIGVWEAPLREDGRVLFPPVAAHWAYAEVRGEHSRPWNDEAAWAASAVLWLKGPV